ncbi:Ternary complex factor MIP1 leucine-zipper-containing protein [Dioscorea alata]|uniref:Ternary complex factor MIP1 leucine-zipper-containing protein n=2 Tax=Dioscorea alata TaxID=55571 RepID=A0ACB7VJ08_DIOAL|nr:Ternary complex factor MIP1 leucine-zipper-containing protein [Dioscorea alata]KAH7673996.1 Ternary complex factor MIP1 leucine-zipper-containing protein [Dioscorea alata]
MSASFMRRHSTSVIDHENKLNAWQESPRLSHHNQGRQNEENSSSTEEIPNQKPTTELVKEIAALELEVVNLERHLLSLYRSVFYQCHTNSAAKINQSSPLEFEDESIQVGKTFHANSYQQFGRKNHSHCNCDGIKKNRASDCKQIEKSPAQDFPTNFPLCREAKIDIKRNFSARRTLADHLGTSTLIDNLADKSCRLSKDILRCVAAIYCKLSNPPIQQTQLFNSATPSASPSSSFSPQNLSDNWSPQCNYDVASSPLRFESVTDKSSSYISMIEVPKISVDGERFDYASKMLNIFRSLIQQLETVNPSKMKHEEQLAFWINIHNALVMHAFLAYGLHQNQMKSSTLSILKAAYNIGGCSVNAYDIQSSILRCQPHRSALWLRVIFSPTMKFTKANNKHKYAIDHPEPLVHFALSLGAHSDPGVRVYTSKNVLQDLKLAKQEYIQANVSIRKGHKITMPKLLYHYAKDANLELSDIIETICNCMPETRQTHMQRNFKGSFDKHIKWSSYKSTFRYLVHRDLAKDSESLFKLSSD